MRALLLTLGFMAMAVSSALAGAVQPKDAAAYAGQTATVEGTVSDVHTAKGSGMTFLDLGGRYPENPFTAVIFRDHASQFPNVGSLAGKTVDVTGTVTIYKGKPQIILQYPGQLKVR
jgi:DNA/RNA endonuclease YhcR with UshA esterase domain